ncbi:histidine kinase [Flavobacterium sp. 245]|uniref:sensor histidine kinase n=1 Tax=Flavobacterium sp. 245 TaxID=2512115 RepID=UPI00105F44AB|nr:histidine kinase [Flavobacterium sp. 245]TDO95599.1 two component regulator with propeller domain [Flavobacterium sp. 245]
MLFRNNYTFCFLFLLISFSWAQQKPSKNYTTADGLPNNAVRSLFIDKASNLWIGTENGISILENGNFTNLVFPKNISNYSCWDIIQDSKGNMWFASYAGGVYTFNGKKFTVINQKKGLANDRARKLFTYENKIFVGTELGVSIIDINTNQVLNPKGIEPHFGVFIVSDFFVYKNEVYFSAINEGLFKISYSKASPLIKKVISYRFAYSLGFYDNIIFSGNKGFLDRFRINDTISNRISSEPFGKSIVWDFVKDKRNTLYAAAWGVFDLSGGLYKIENSQMEEISEQFGLDSKNLLNVVYNSKKDILYVGSKDKGIYEIGLDNPINYNSFSNKTIVDLEKWNDEKIILHQDGISFLDHKNNVLQTINLTAFKNFEFNYIKTSTNKLPTHKDGFYELNYETPASKIEFYEVLKHHNSLWVTSNIGIFEINSKKEIKNYLPIHTYKIGFTNDNKFIETIPYGGVRVYDNVYQLKAKHFSEFDSNTPVDIVGIANTEKKTYLISVFKGLFEYGNHAFHSLLNKKIWAESKLKFITKNKDGHLIVASEFGAVSVLDVSKSFRVLKMIPKNKIIGNTITFLEAYEDYIFIGTEKGINICKDNTIRLFDKEQGLNDCDVTASSIIENQLWLGTKKGFFTIDLKKIIQTQETVSKIEIRAISINSIPIKESNFNWFTYNSNQLICDYKHNTFSIDFVPKGHSFPNKLKFRYRLKATNQWSPYFTKPTIYLSYLPNDNYNLEIQVSDLNAGITSAFKVLNIIVNPPFWKTWWFYTLLLVVMTAGILSIILRIKKQTRQKALTENLIAKAKLEALLSQMNPHFTFNALNTIQRFVFNRDAIHSAIYISEFAYLMRQTLDNSSKQTITIEDEIEYLTTYISIENQRFGNKIKHQIMIDENIDVYETVIPTMFLQPFVENIFKHAFGGNHLHPEFKIEFLLLGKNLLEIKITDNGKATKKVSKMHVSRGITIARERIQILQPKNTNPIQIDFSENGTTVQLQLFI